MQDLYKTMSDALNGGEYRIRETLREEFRKEHRTLQQSYVRSFIIPVLELLAEDYENGYYDLRNEAACKFAKEALEATRNIGLPLI